MSGRVPWFDALDGHHVFFYAPPPPPSVGRRSGTAGPWCNPPDEATLDALRRALLTMMSDWSEGAWAAGWMSGTEEMLHEQGGVWEILGRYVGWPTGYEHDADFRWVTWDEAGRIFAERKAARARARASHSHPEPS